MKIRRGDTVNLSNVDEDLEIEDGVRITCSGDASTLVVRGDVLCDGGVDFVGDVKCDDFEGMDGSITISGSLQCDDLEIKRDAEIEVSKDVHAQDAEVDKILRVGGRIEAHEIEVGGKFETTDVKAVSVSVGGVFEARGEVDVEEIEVGGKLEIGGKIKSRNLSVGGKARLGAGGSVADEIEVGGFLDVDGPLEYGTIDVGGTAKLNGMATGRDIDVGGTFEVWGNLNFKDMDVGGYAHIKGDAIGKSIDLGGRLSVGNALRLSGPLEIGGQLDIGGEAEAEDVEIGGEFNASSLKVRNIELSGAAKTDNGIFATEDIHVGHRSTVRGWIKASREIEIESRSEVESASARKIVMDDRSRAKNVYGEDVELGDRVEITGELLYTRSIRTGDEVRFAKQPEKVSSIPTEKSWVVFSETRTS